MKSLNLLVDGNFSVKVADFGESRDLAPQIMTKGIGTYLWMAPEVMNQQEYTSAADIFSMGVVLWELFMRILPDRKPDHISKGIMPPLPAECPKDYRRIVSMCCDPKPTKRPSSQILAGLLTEYYKTITEVALTTVQNAVKAEVEEEKPKPPPIGPRPVSTRVGSAVFTSSTQSEAMSIKTRSSSMNKPFLAPPAGASPGSRSSPTSPLSNSGGAGPRPLPPQKGGSVRVKPTAERPVLSEDKFV